MVIDLNPAPLLLLLLAVGMVVSGFYLIYPPLALIAGGLATAGLAALLIEVKED